MKCPVKHCEEISAGFEDLILHLANPKQNNHSEVRIDNNAQLSTRNKDGDIDQAIRNEVDGEFDFLPELPGKERRDITLPHQNKDKVWSCIICDKIFKTKYYLKEHSRMHTGETNIC